MTSSLVIAMRRDVGAAQFLVAISAGLTANHTPAQLASLSGQIAAFKSNLAAIGEARSGDSIHVDDSPAAGTRILVNGAQKGAAIPGPELYRAVLRVWLGDAPVDAGLKQALLGL